MTGAAGQAAELRGSGHPLGGSGLTAESYADFVAKEYLGDYVRHGGASVKIIVPGRAEVSDRWHRLLAAAAASDGYLFAEVDAAAVRVHLIHEVYAAVARQVDWEELVRRQVQLAWDSIGLPAASPDDLTVMGVAT